MEKLQQLYAALNAGQITFADYATQAQPIIDSLRQTGDLNLSLIAYTPQAIQAAMTSANQQEFMQKMQGYQGLAQAGVDLTQLAMAYDQIRTASRAAAQSIPPALPSVPGPNPQLSEQLYDAQRRANDISYATAPATQQLNQAYTQAVGQAQAASGGQAGNYQALANLANQQRMQAALNLVPLAQQTRMQNQAQVNDLLGMRLQEQQNMFQNQMQQFQYPYEQFNLQQQAIGALGSQGRTRAFDVVSRLPDYLQYLPYDEDTNNFIKNTAMETKRRQYEPYEFGPPLSYDNPTYDMIQRRVDERYKNK